MHIVSHEEWLAAHRAHLAREKAFTRLREDLARARRELPWERIDQVYSFEGPEGRLGLADLFGDLGQLVVYHFMLGPDWKEGCPSCSFWADNFNGVDVHLAHRDTALVAISRAPLASIEAYRKRMGWKFEWISSAGTTFNYDFGVSFHRADLDAGPVMYNFRVQPIRGGEQPGLTVFVKGEDGSIYRTYSTYERGLDMLLTAYHYIDLTPLGRNESGPMDWVQRHDQYEG